jgi:hypothetical protein
MTGRHLTARELAAQRAAAAAVARAAARAQPAPPPEPDNPADTFITPLIARLMRLDHEQDTRNAR